MQIVKTTDYSSFKLIMSNREIDQNHVRKLIQSIRRKNLLAIRPLIVNEKMMLIDGQHRLHAAKEIGAEVYYIKVEGLTKSDIAVLNTAQKNWTRSDFINFYAAEGNENYIQLAKFIDKYYWLQVSIILQMICTSESDRDGLREGTLKVMPANLKRAYQMADWLRALEPGFPFITESRCAIAFLHKVNTPGKVHGIQALRE